MIRKIDESGLFELVFGILVLIMIIISLFGVGYSMYNHEERASITYEDGMDTD